jgi:hypothetical protein
LVGNEVSTPNRKQSGCPKDSLGEAKAKDERGFVETSWAVMKLVRLIGNNQVEVKAKDERGFVETSWSVMKLVRPIRNNKVEVKAKDERDSDLSLCCWKYSETKV